MNRGRETNRRTAYRSFIHFVRRSSLPGAASSSRSLVSYSVRYAGRDCKERPRPSATSEASSEGSLGEERTKSPKGTSVTVTGGKGMMNRPSEP